MALAEFALIERYFSAGAGPGFATPAIARGIGDDCALLDLAPDEQLAVSMDLLVETVHFPQHAEPRLLGQRALLVNLSDLAAMGARPLGFTLGLSLPAVDETWLAAFSRGLTEVARAQDCPLIGGDTTRGPLTLCIQVHGAVPRGSALLRSGARPGDLVCVTGTLGDGAAGLAVVQGRTDLPEAAQRELLAAFYQPTCRLAAGQALRGLASSAIDLSDGLASDLLHILHSSGVGARIDVDRLPLSAAFCLAVPLADRAALALGGGDDYELCVTLPERHLQEAQVRLRKVDAGLTVIGRIEEARGLRWFDNGKQSSLTIRGYTHFA